MKTECSPEQVEFQGIWNRPIVAGFDGGQITTDAGVLLLGEVERRRGDLKRFAECFRDERNPEYVEHELESLVKQRVFGICLGYEDLNDHDWVRSDGLFAAVCGKDDVLGRKRRRVQDRGKGLAGKSTLNRLELSEEGQSRKDRRYKKVYHDAAAIERFFVEAYLRGKSKAPGLLILDLDATDDPLHGQQEGRFFHGYYNCYCYLPLYIFCGEELLAAKLRCSGIDASEGSIVECDRIVGQIRRKWPEVRILLRADSGFCREGLMKWCEDNGVEYLFGLARNTRLHGMIRRDVNKMGRRWAEKGRKRAQRTYRELHYSTRKTWSRKRRVVAKAEWTQGKGNPRFVVTSLSTKEYPAKRLYEKLYCPRGEMENRIKEQQLWLFADRTSTAKMRANQLRLWFSSAAYVMMSALRRLGLRDTELARAQCHTIRVKLLKVGAQVSVSVRRMVVRMADSHPLQGLFPRIVANLRLDTS